MNTVALIPALARIERKFRLSTKQYAYTPPTKLSRPLIKNHETLEKRKVSYTSTSYWQGSSNKQLLWEFSSSSSTSSSSHLVYAPDISYTVHTANGGSYKASGYDGSGNYNSSQSSQQAIVDSYAVGHTYSCWYDASNPTNAVLVRNPNWLFFIMAAVLITVGMVFSLASILIMLKRPKLTANSTPGHFSIHGEITLSSKK